MPMAPGQPRALFEIIFQSLHQHHGVLIRYWRDLQVLGSLCSCCKSNFSPGGVKRALVSPKKTLQLFAFPSSGAVCPRNTKWAKMRIHFIDWTQMNWGVKKKKEACILEQPEAILPTKWLMWLYRAFQNNSYFYKRICMRWTWLRWK